LGIEAVSDPSESAFSIFLQNQIPSITVGLTRGTNFHQNDAVIEIEPLFKGIAQIPSLVMAMDNGVCDAKRMD
jgi:tripeptide aminopeptidase